MDAPLAFWENVKKRTLAALGSNSGVQEKRGTTKMVPYLVTKRSTQWICCDDVQHLINNNLVTDVTSRLQNNNLQKKPTARSYSILTRRRNATTRLALGAALAAREQDAPVRQSLILAVDDRSRQLGGSPSAAAESANSRRCLMPLDSPVAAPSVLASPVLRAGASG